MLESTLLFNKIMKKKMGRPLLAGSPKNILVATRVDKAEQRRIQRDAKSAGKTKSEWLREKLLGSMAQPSKGDLRTLWSPARILSLDGQELSKGLIKLRVAPALGVFVPDHIPCPSLGIPPETKLVAEIGKHRFALSDWRPCGATVDFSEPFCELGPHYHFLCPES